VITHVPKAIQDVPPMHKAKFVFARQVPVWKLEWILCISWTATTTYAISLNDGDSSSRLAGQPLTWLKIFEDFSCLVRSDDGKNIHRAKI
jgi:hypothetical protein